MDSLKKNKFLTSYLAVLVVGGLGLGYMLFSSYKSRQTAEADFEEAKQAVATLQGKPLFPNAENLKARAEQVEAFAATVSDLQKRLVAEQPALEENAQSDKFQSTLTQTLNDLKAQAELTKLGSRSGADFDLGFGQYLGKLPSSQAVPDLLFQLGGLKALVVTMLTDRVASIDDIRRGTLDVEVAQADDAAAKPAGGRAAAGAKKSPGSPSVLDESLVLKRYPMEIRFSGSPRSVQDVLNHLAERKDYFFAIRSLRIENERKQGPVKGALAQSSEQTKKDSEIVLGGESISIWLSVDLIRFLDPVVATAEAKAGAKAVN